MRSLLIDLGRFLRRSGMSATAFGRQAANDTRSVFDLRRGRICGGEMRQRIYGFIADQERRINEPAR